MAAMRSVQPSKEAVRLIAGAALVAALAAPSLAAAADARPPGAGTLTGAYYLCDGGKNALTVQFAGDKDARATLVTSVGKTYELKKAPAPNGGFHYVGQKVDYTSDGTNIVIKGALNPYAGCVRKN